MKEGVQKTVHFQEATLKLKNQSKGEEWRELLLPENLTEKDDREEWEPATTKISVIQRDAPPKETIEIPVKEAEATVEVYLAVAERTISSGFGISFTRANANSPLCIDHVASDGPFEYSGLQSGMVVSSINSKYMTWKSPGDALMELANDDTMIVTAEFAPDKYYCKEYTMVVQASMECFDGEYGISFARKGDNLPLYVNEVQEYGPFRDLLPGLKVIAIDDQFMLWESPESAQEALDSIQDSIKRITVEATTERVNTTLHRVELEMTESNEVIITEVTSYSMQCTCDLRKGMKVIMLNGQVCSEVSSIDKLMIGADVMWDIIAVDLSCRKVPAREDASPKEIMLELCGAGALGMAALSLTAVGMCTDPLNQIIAQHQATREEWKAKGLAFLIRVQESATGDAVDANGVKGINDASDKALPESHSTTENFDLCARDTTKLTSETSSSNEAELNRSPSNEEVEAVERTTPKDKSEETLQGSGISIISRDSNADDKPLPKLQDSSDRALYNTESKAKRSLAMGVILESNEMEDTTSKQEEKDREAIMPFFSVEEKRRKNSKLNVDGGNTEDEGPKEEHSFEIKKISNEDVGLQLAQGQNGGVYVAEIKDHSKFRSTGLKPGMRIAKINGIDCPSSMRVTTSFINGVDGKLSLVTTFGAKPKSKKRREIFFTDY